jgi:hypothetical protein
MGVEWIAVGAVLAAGALFGGFPIGVFVGYRWRDRISRNRRLRVALERGCAELGLPRPNTSDRAIRQPIEINQPTVRARKRTVADASVEKRPRRQGANKAKLTVVASDARQEPPARPGSNTSTPAP